MLKTFFKELRRNKFTRFFFVMFILAVIIGTAQVNKMDKLYTDKCHSYDMMFKSLSKQVTSSYQNGYNAAILDAEVISINDSGYSIDFAGEVHDYTFECNCTIKLPGTWELTGYCPCSICCGEYANGITSTGVIAEANHTIAVDPTKIPYGTIVTINGVEYRAEDCGGAIKGNRIDVFFNTHQEALNFGRKKGQSVYMVK